MSARQPAVPLSHALRTGQWDTARPSWDTDWDTKRDTRGNAAGTAGFCRDSLWDTRRDSERLECPTDLDLCALRGTLPEQPR
jgi:hypothetical protein